MSANAEHSLFDGRGRLPIGLGVRSVTTLTALLTVLSLQTLAVSIAMAGVALALMLADRVDPKRAIVPLVFLANLTLLLVLWRLAGLDLTTALHPLARAFAGACWLSWFGGTVAWTAFKRRFLAQGRRRFIADFVDQGIFHGQLLLDQTAKRFDAAFLRIGHKYRRPGNVALALAGGVAMAFDRAVTIEEACRLRRPPGLPAGSANTPASSAYPSSALLSVSKVLVLSGERRALLSGIDFELGPGEWLFLAGQSGSGKTTLLRAICGLQAVSSGAIACQGQAVRPRCLNPYLALAFQNPDDQFFATTPLDDVVWGLKARGWSDATAIAQAQEVLDELGIAHLRDQPLSRLSFGEKRRVAMAGLLACKPRLLLCDEPTSGLDATASARLIRAIERATSQEATAVIWVSHDLHLVPRQVKKVLLLNGGRQLCYAAPAEAFARPMLESAGLALREEDTGAMFTSSEGLGRFNFREEKGYL